MVWKTFTFTAWAAMASASAPGPISLGLLGHCTEILQKPFESTAGFLRRSLGIQKRLGGPIDSTALRVAQDQHQAATQLSGAELQAANDGCVQCLGVATLGQPGRSNSHDVEQRCKLKPMRVPNSRAR